MLILQNFNHYTAHTSLHIWVTPDLNYVCVSSYIRIIYIYIYIGKGKSIPVQAWTGPQGSRRLRILDFMTVST
jgi:hypothetical protein